MLNQSGNKNNVCMATGDFFAELERAKTLADLEALCDHQDKARCLSGAPDTGEEDYAVVKFQAKFSNGITCGGLRGFDDNLCLTEPGPIEVVLAPGAIVEVTRLVSSTGSYMDEVKDPTYPDQPYALDSSDSFEPIGTGLTFCGLEE